MPQVACFDTGVPPARSRTLAQIFALPRELTEAGIRRYGFHGLSYEYVSGRLREVAPEHGRQAHHHRPPRQWRQPVRYRQGPQRRDDDGLHRGRRPDDGHALRLDRSRRAHLPDGRARHGCARARRPRSTRSPACSACRGFRPTCATLRASDDPKAREAIDLFIYRIVREIGSLAAALGGLDGMVFTGGIGQRDTKTRQEVVAGCAWLGAVLERGSERGSRAKDRCDSIDACRSGCCRRTRRRVICRHTAALLGL